MPQTGAQNNIETPRKWKIVAQGEGHGSATGEETHASTGAHAGGEEHGPENPLAEHPAYYYSYVALGVAVVLTGLVLWWRRNGLNSRKPSRGQSLLEQAVESITWFSRNAIGSGGEKYAPFIGTIFAFVLLSNLCGVLPFYWKSHGNAAASFTPAPTANLSMTVALGLIVFGVFNYVGIQKNGAVNYFKHFAGPIPALSILMFPIEIIGALVRPISLAIRLFGNVFGEETVIAVLIAMSAAIFIPLQFPMLVFGVFGSVVQAGVFTILTCAYIALAIGDHGDHEHGDHSDDHAHGAPAGAH